MDHESFVIQMDKLSNPYQESFTSRIACADLAKNTVILPPQRLRELSLNKFLPCKHFNCNGVLAKH